MKKFRKAAADYWEENADLLWKCAIAGAVIGLTYQVGKVQLTQMHTARAILTLVDMVGGPEEFEKVYGTKTW